MNDLAPTDGFQINVRLVKEDPEERIVVAVIAEGEGGSRKRLVYILIGISVILAIVLGVTLTTRSSQSGTTPSPTSAPTPAPTLAPTETTAPTATPSQLESMISLIQSRSASTTFSNSVSPQNQALDWIWCSDLLWQPFITAQMVAIGVMVDGWSQIMNAIGATAMTNLLT